jgi:MoaA/NifB/PqqE/SkfB family radical SAM enzyme
VTATRTVADAIADGQLGGRVWFYANYHCNLTCTYCLTESAPKVDPRVLGAERMLALADEARALGFAALGVTGGEPFILRDMARLAAELGRILPTVVLSNGTLFSDRLLDELRPLADLPVQIQISLDRPDPIPNDEMRGPENYRKVVEAIPRLVDAGIGVRIATTLEHDEITEGPTEDHERLCKLHREFGVSDDDHVIRPIVRRGRAATNALGVLPTRDDLFPELTIVRDGAFWNPFAPTVRAGVLDTDLLITRTIQPLEVPTNVLLRLVDGREAGADTRLGIR